MTKCEIILYSSKVDESFIAEVPELACGTADGASRQEALANVETVIARWLETASELGVQFLNPKLDCCLRRAIA